MIRAAFSCLVLLALGACATGQRVAQIGQPPTMAPIENPVVIAGRDPIVMPMPAPQAELYAPNSLWRAGARTFFNDQRANQVGDILTVNIDITDRATVSNSTQRSRSGAESMSLASIFGLESALDTALADSFDPANAADFGSDSSTAGTGNINRAETVQLTVAAVVTQVLPNGNMVIAGRQEVRVNYEVRELLVSGVIRPADISAQNTIAHTQIAEARISYGGRGHITELQKPRYGQEFWEIVSPF
jgi:flagellar L-ring protein precursor FlgH